MAPLDREGRFSPHLGRVRQSPARLRKRQTYLAQILHVRALNHSKARDVAAPAAPGGRLQGRGAGIGRLLKMRQSRHRPDVRRVVVKTHKLNPQAAGRQALLSHLRYIQRDGVSRNGAPGQLYGPDPDAADARAFVDRSAADRRQYRIVLAPDDGAEYSDLRSLTRRLMLQMERDLGTRLDWIAADHFDTGHPHSHILLRGRDDRGRALEIAGDYLNHGLRERAMELATLDLGPPENGHVAAARRREVLAERLTGIDLRLRREAGPDNIVRAIHADGMQQSLRAGRLHMLHQLGLAEPLGPATWRLRRDMAQTLQRMGERRIMMAILHRHLQARSPDRAISGYGILAAGATIDRALTGELIAHGRAAALAQRPYLILNTIDGRALYVDRAILPAGLTPGCILQVMPGGGPLSAAGAPQPAMARGAGRDLRITPLSPWPLARQIGFDGATWLDRLLLSGPPPALRQAGFGKAVIAALAARRQWLLQHGLASRQGANLVCPKDLLQQLQRREIARLSRALGLDYAGPPHGAALRGIYRGSVELAEGRYAVIANRRQFTLAPWQPVLERHRGALVIGSGHDGAAFAWRPDRSRVRGIG